MTKKEFIKKHNITKQYAVIDNISLGKVVYSFNSEKQAREFIMKNYLDIYIGHLKKYPYVDKNDLLSCLDKDKLFNTLLKNMSYIIINLKIYKDNESIGWI